MHVSVFAGVSAVQFAGLKPLLSPAAFTVYLFFPEVSAVIRRDGIDWDFTNSSPSASSGESESSNKQEERDSPYSPFTE